MVRDRVVRHGHGAHRAIQTGVGPVEVRRAKVRDRGEVGAEEKIRFTSSILAEVGAAWTKSLDALLPIFLLPAWGVDWRLPGSPRRPHGQGRAEHVAGGDLAANGRIAGGLRRLAEAQRPLGATVRVRVGGRGLSAGPNGRWKAPPNRGMLVLIGATPEGKKELVGFQTGVRESAQSWRELLIDIKQRGLEIAPDLAVGDGALGFWKAIEQVFPSTRHQRCWVHKTANVLNKVALSVQINMKGRSLREISYGAPTRGGGRGSDRSVRRQIQCQARQGGRLSDQGPGSAARLF